MSTDVYLEIGAKRVFASAAEWPGWCRAGKTEELALAALEASAPRYAAVARTAGLPFPGDPARFDVVERLPGSATTDFGAPGETAAREAAPLNGTEAERLAGLLAAVWALLDRVVSAAPAELHKGPRGGGRDRDAIFQHVVGAEAAYARKVGVRMAEPGPGDRAAVEALRHAVVDAVRAATGKAEILGN
ncbi:MAG TPA: hypothetical protein VGR61_05955, partial [Candidatus Dormibacteraeota bacterium]|nr:hypothetical protein [Candidatus Dormibacteraeota bacterium]